jgi:DNA-binding transcriptional ArsR family regulator
VTLKPDAGEDASDRLFKALGSRTRRGLLDLLKDQPRTTGDLCERFPELDRCTVMQHLKVLEDAELVVATRRGRERWNRLDMLPIAALQDRWLGQYAAPSAAQLNRLKRELEDAD